MVLRCKEKSLLSKQSLLPWKQSLLAWKQSRVLVKQWRLPLKQWRLPVKQFHLPLKQTRLALKQLHLRIKQWHLPVFFQQSQGNLKVGWCFFNVNESWMVVLKAIIIPWKAFYWQQILQRLASNVGIIICRLLRLSFSPRRPNRNNQKIMVVMKRFSKKIVSF